MCAGYTCCWGNSSSRCIKVSRARKDVQIQSRDRKSEICNKVIGCNYWLNAGLVEHGSSLKRKARRWKGKATFNTTNLIRHLKNKHPTQYSEFTQATHPKTSQLTLQESLKRREKMPHDSAKVQDITAKIAQMIAMSDLPFTFVENPGFLMLIEHVEPRFEMPSRHYFTEKALPALYKKISDKLLVLLSDVDIGEGVFVHSGKWKKIQDNINDSLFVKEMAVCIWGTNTLAVAWKQKVAPPQNLIPDPL
ncbi:E3 SUMO-protein ligase ZBED1 [Labeo rohita]|uniref:E3 SUMO-protein ligase ZBED1 n=1 Tax=Labeo rohita TaxID=84645 RepID=A0ABQ8MSV8_LABRO|nr:E3 SUMO-protein ligase ZBED1 [Labeo rohita]